MKKAIIITSYIEGSLPCLMADFQPDYIFCADGGYHHAKESGITPDYVIGDLDSLKEQIDPSSKIITYPAEKDDTDTGLCLQAALDMNCRDILIIGGMGGRFDHSIANIQLIAGHIHEADRIAIKDDKNYCTILQNGTLHLTKESGHHVSILSLSDTSEGVSVSGLKYPLNNDTLTRTFPLGVSNEFQEEEAVISVRKGTLLIALTQD